MFEKSPFRSSRFFEKTLQGSRDGFPALWLPGFLLRICQGTWANGQRQRVHLESCKLQRRHGSHGHARGAPELTRLAAGDSLLRWLSIWLITLITRVVATQIFFYFHPLFGEDEPILTIIFQMG